MSNLFERQIRKVEQDLVQLRLRYRNEPHNRSQIKILAHERQVWLDKLKKGQEFWENKP